MRPHLLPATPDIPARVAGRISADHARCARDGLPRDVEGYLLGEYGLDVASRYAGAAIKNPWGKASGQLSMLTGQVREDAESGLGFVVLKTVIAQDAHGTRAMDAWAVREGRMVVEPIVGRESGAAGWTVTWKGRGWWQSFEAYLDLVRAAVATGRGSGMAVAPSVKYHLPGPDEQDWRVDEYVQTTRALLGAFRAGGGVGPMPLEKDFSPTLAGSDRARQRASTLGWLATVPGLIRKTVDDGDVRVGLKLFNSLEGEGFQHEMLARVHLLAGGPDGPDFLVHANRLFDPDRTFEGCRGVAYGGPDLSDRNLRVLSTFRAAQAAGLAPRGGLEISATGDIGTGKMAIEYALRGCTSFQIHTLFQCPPERFAMSRGTRVARALHALYFHPESGLVVWLLHAAHRLGLGTGGTVRLTDVAAAGAGSALRKFDLDT